MPAFPHMVIELLSEKRPGKQAIATYLRPRADMNGEEPEERVVFCGVSWDDYLAVDEALGHDCPGPRLYYLDEELEIMTTSLKHEKLKKWIGDFIADFLFERDITAFPTGEATMRIMGEAGAEPDESWCIGEEAEFPHLVVEVALTSGGISKLELYRRFGIGEVWIWGKEKLEVWTLRRDATGYDSSEKSAVLPYFDFALLARCLAMTPRWNAARRAFREGLRSQS